MTRIAAVADDLSGAAEAASALAGISRITISEPGVRLYLHTSGQEFRTDEFDGSVLVLDADTRRANARDQGSLFLNALEACTRWRYDVFFLKTDSLLRGHLESHLRSLLARGPVIFSPAFPSLDRTVRQGQVQVNGIPLHKTSLWSVEAMAPPISIADAVSNLPVVHLSLETLRGPRQELHSAIALAIRQGSLLVADAETDHDLETLVRSSFAFSGIQFAGSAALARALGSITTDLSSSVQQAAAPNNLPVKPSKSPAIICGSASDSARGQIQALSRHGVPSVELNASQILDSAAELINVLTHAARDTGPLVVSISPSPVQPGLNSELSRIFSRICAPIAASRPCLLTGGETARAILEANNISWLQPLRVLEHGAVLSLTNQQTFVATRPGSFGKSDSFLNILHGMEAYFAMLSETKIFAKGQKE